MGGENDKSFWLTLPGILTGIAAIITAISLILGTLHAIGYLKVSDNSIQVTPTPVTPVPITPTSVTPTIVPDNLIAISSPTPTQASTSPPKSALTRLEINITYPTSSSKVHMDETVKGTAKNIPEGQQLWIVTLCDEKYYPQNYADIQSDGSWKLPVQIGEGNMVGSEYLILAVLADKNAQNEFNNYLNAFEKTGVYPEMKKLPEVSKVRDGVKVTRV